MKILITGSKGFIGKNLCVHLYERDDIQVVTFTHEDKPQVIAKKLNGVEFVFHMAGVNRSENIEEFARGNVDLTDYLCRAIEETGNKISIIYCSSIQAESDNPYGKSKLAAEESLIKFSGKTGCPVYIFRLPNVFGKWCKPNYNSVVATFSHSIARDLPIKINDPSAIIQLIYVDDVVKRFISIMDGSSVGGEYCYVEPEYEISVGELAEKIKFFKESRVMLRTGSVGVGLDRALYSTYLSYLEPEQFSYAIPKYEDDRGVFVEMLKTKNSGQFSYFTAHKGVTRGGHYHHTKNEKFLVLKGEALFKFRHVVTNDYYELKTSGKDPIVVETVPGWTHDITNIGNDEMFVMLFANEVFDPDHPDTYAKSL